MTRLTGQIQYQSLGIPSGICAKLQANTTASTSICGDPAPRFLSEEGCVALIRRAAGFSVGGGQTDIFLESRWSGDLAWGRNRITTSGDIQENSLSFSRSIRGAWASVACNQIDDIGVESAIRRAERLLLAMPEKRDASMRLPITEGYGSPTLWFDRTYQLDAAARAEVMRTVVQPAEKTRMLSAGYLAVSAVGAAAMNNASRVLYHPATYAQYSVTVRDPEGNGSGWAGVDWNDWGRIDASTLSAVALEKCLMSRHPVALEPGRYLTILEPQAVCDFLSPLFARGPFMDRASNEKNPDRYPFAGEREGTTKIGELLLDERITITADPMDPDLGFLPFDVRRATADSLPVYHPATWFEQGVLMRLAYDRQYAITELGENTGLPNSGAFRMSGGTTSLEEMITSTKRGLLVTRFSDVYIIDERSTLSKGYTRDGLWLIENGKISKAIKNFQFTEGIVIALNNVIALGLPQRVFHPEAPVVVPPLQIRDFSFTALIDSV